MLWIGYRLADLISAIIKILALPLTVLGRLQKKIKKLAKNIFLFAEKWYRINQITQEMESTARRRADREKGGASNASETRGTVDKIGRRGAFGVSGHLSAGSAGQIQSAQEEQETLAQQVKEQRLANQQLEDAIENSDDPETLERVAREKGYVKEGETLYIDVPADGSTGAAGLRAVPVRGAASGGIYKEDILVSDGIWCWVRFGRKGNGNHKVRRLRGPAGGTLRSGPYLGDRLYLCQ